VMAATDARNNMRAVGSGVFSAVRAEAIGWKRVCRLTV
jgi:hypothetical protein